MFNTNQKFYFGTQSLRETNELSLGTIGLLEQYSTKLSSNHLKTPWFTIMDAKQWCKDDEEQLYKYLKQGIEKKYLILLNETQANRLLKDPIHNCWLYETL